MEDKDLLEELVFEVLERRDRGETNAVDSVCKSHPHLASAVRRQIAELERIGLIETGSDLPDAIGEFRIQKRLGQGGMGVVFMAEQPSLGRRVALKVLRPDQLFFRGTRQRFQREIEAVARLAHPGIVPLFSSGEEDGVPFFAMELVEGVSLAEVLDALRSRAGSDLDGQLLYRTICDLCAKRGFEAPTGDSTDPLFAGSWQDASTWLAREVGQALEHAHQRGILHRDVKPSNVLVTPLGRVMLVDFGLAASEGTDRLTHTGSQLGSLPYMSPEQVAGRVNAIEARTDVYSLGLTLYELATLTLPFEGATTADLSQRIELGGPESPRRRNPSLSADFDVVCKKAIEVDPARRYTSAAHLARDLTNLLERTPVEARPIGPVVTLMRWSKRRPAASAVLALGAVMAIGGPLGFGVQEARAKGRVLAERDVAAGHLDAALDAIEHLLEQVGHSDLRDIPGVEDLRKDLLERATTLYARLESAPNPSTRTRLRVAIALGKLAQLRRDTGDREGALIHFDEAEARLAALAEESPGDFEVLDEYGTLLLSACATRHLSDPQIAITALAPAIRTLRRAVELAPAAYRPRANLARGLCLLGHFQDVGGEPAASRSTYVEALERSNELRQEQPDDRVAWETWGTAMGRIGNIDYFEGKKESAERTMQTMFSETSTLEKPSSFMRQLRGNCVNMLVRARSAREGEARDAEIDLLLDTAHQDLMALSEDFPHNPSYASSLGSSWLELGDREERFGEVERAIECFEQAARRFEGIHSSTPEDSRAWRNAGLAAERLAAAYRRREDLTSAVLYAERAVGAHGMAHHLGGELESAGDYLTASRGLLNLYAMRQETDEVVRVSRELASGLPRSFDASIDAAHCLVDAWKLDGGEDLRAEARALLERALQLAPQRAQVVTESLLEWGVADDPGFSGLGASRVMEESGD